MKSSYFSRSSGEIRIIKSKDSKARFNWDKIVYLTIFTVLIGYLIYYLGHRMLVIKETGQVQFETLEIQYFKDIQIDKFYFNEGDSVEVGDTIFSFHIEHGDLLTYAEVEMERYQKVSETLSKHTSQIRIKEAELESLRSLLQFTKAERSRVEKEVLLSVYTSSRVDPYVRKEEELKSSIFILEKEIEALKSITPVITKAYTISPNQNNHYQYFTSPIAGTVAHKYMTEHETVLESEHIMSLFLPHKNVHIKTFFTSDDMKYLKIGDEVDLYFPNGQKSVGIIKQFFYDTYELPVQFDDYSEDVYKRIEADLVPLHPEDQQLWNASIKLTVDVRKSKFW